MTRIVQCLSHSIESYDQLRLYTELGIEAVDIGGYIDPQNPHDPKRPPVPGAPFVSEIKAAIDGIDAHDRIAAAQGHIPDAVLDWLGDDGVIVYHHYLERLFPQWPRLKDWMAGSGGRRIVWRTVGQSVENNERMMAVLRAQGLSIVRYSPKERNIPGYAGEDALIRFYKDPDEWQGWTGETAAVLNFTQNLAQRDPYTNHGFWDAATRGLPRMPMGPGSEAIDGPGEVSFEAMKRALREYRVYLYTGTQPASYTLGLIEAMMTGIPVVSIGPAWMRVFPYGPDLFEGHDLAMRLPGNTVWEAEERNLNDPAFVRGVLEDYLKEPAHRWSALVRAKAIEVFGKATIARQWADFLGAAVPA